MKRVIETKFFEFNQNNSGGYFEINKRDGIAPSVIIEAVNAREAISKSEDIFASYSNYCRCCGERWSTWLDDSDGKDEPMIYSTPVKEAIKESSYRSSAAVHYYDGRIEWIGLDPDKDE